MSKFDKEFKRATEQINKDIEKTIRAASIELFGEIVRRTPVGNPSLWQSKPPRGYTGGSLRGNWQAQINSPNKEEVNIHDKSGISTIFRATTHINKFNLKDRSIWFSNNLPYAERVEQGWSKQRPQGMVRTTVKAFKPIMDKLARRQYK